MYCVLRIGIITVIDSLSMASESTAQAPENGNSKVSTSDTINLPPIAREILENYPLIPANEVAPHVARIVCHLPSSYSRICKVCVLLTTLFLRFESYR